MKRVMLLFILSGVTWLSGCGLPTGPEGYNYRRQLIVETNLSELRIDNTHLDSTTTYPYVLFDELDSSNGTLVFYIYPIQDSGFIKLKLYGGESQYTRNPSISFKDSLTIYTPIDTTGISIIEYKIVL